MCSDNNAEEGREGTGTQETVNTNKRVQDAVQCFWYYPRKKNSDDKNIGLVYICSLGTDTSTLDTKRWWAIIGDFTWVIIGVFRWVILGDD